MKKIFLSLMITSFVFLGAGCTNSTEQSAANQTRQVSSNETNVQQQSQTDTSSETNNLEVRSKLKAGDLNQKVLLPSYNFFDNGSLIAANGTWLGKGVGYPLNVIDISCWQTNNICTIAEVDLSENILMPPDVKMYTPTTWNQYEIIIDNGDLGYLACSRDVVRLDRISKQVTLTRTPVNSDTKHCTTPPSDQGVYSWHLGDGQSISQ